NLSGRADAAWISTALVEMLRSELAAGDRLRTVSEEDVVRMKMELGLGDADSFGASSLARIRTILGADYVVTGSYLALGEGVDARLRVDLRLQDTAQGETVISVTDGGTGRELIDLASRTGGRLRARLGAPELSTDDAVAVRAMLPADPDAARLYA